MREMKDSGVQWIGEMPISWKPKRIKNLFYIVGGNGFPDILQGNECGDYPFCKVSDINGDSKFVSSATNYVTEEVVTANRFNIVPVNSIIFAKIGAALQKNHRKINTVPCCIDNNTEALVPFDSTLVYYYYYLLKTIDMNWFDNKSTIPSINNQRLLAFSVPVPSESEQHAIAYVLDNKCAQVDALIANVQAQIEKLKAYKQSVITEVVTKGLDPTVPMKDSGVEWIGEIPEHWNVVKARRIITSTQNGITRRDLTESKGHIVLKLKNISAGGSIDYSYVNRILLSPKEIETYSLQDGDFLFVRVNGSKGLVGKCAIFTTNGEVVAYNDHIIRVRINGLCHNEFFHYFLLSRVGKTEIEHHTSTSAGQYTISGEGLRDVWLVLPPKDVQETLCRFLKMKCSQIDRLIALKQSKIEKLEQYKKSLIYEYVTGKKEVS